MAFTHTIFKRVTTGGQAIQASNAYSSEGQASRCVDVPVSTVDKEVALTLDVSEIKSIYIISNQDLKLETNNAEAPDNTIDLKANVAYEWNTDSYVANLLTTDITALYLTNASETKVATFQLEVVFDPTP